MLYIMQIDGATCAQKPQLFVICTGTTAVLECVHVFKFYAMELSSYIRKRMIQIGPFAYGTQPPRSLCVCWEKSGR